METLLTIFTFIQANCFMATIDLKDALKDVKIVTTLPFSKFFVI